MKATINGKRYDSDKAILVGMARYGNRGDFQRWSAGLYKTPRAGAFFLAGSGGPMTRWARKVDQNSWSGGEGIHPMSREEALEWAEQYLSSETIEQHFSDVVEDA